jgi:hypothetical protein
MRAKLSAAFTDALLLLLLLLPPLSRRWSWLVARLLGCREEEEERDAAWLSFGALAEEAPPDPWLLFVAEKDPTPAAVRAA